VASRHVSNRIQPHVIASDIKIALLVSRSLFLPSVKRTRNNIVNIHKMALSDCLLLVWMTAVLQARKYSLIFVILVGYIGVS